MTGKLAEVEQLELVIVLTTCSIIFDVNGLALNTVVASASLALFGTLFFLFADQFMGSVHLAVDSIVASGQAVRHCLGPRVVV